MDNPKCTEMKDVLQYHGFNCVLEEVGSLNIFIWKNTGAKGEQRGSKEIALDTFF